MMTNLQLEEERRNQHASFKFPLIGIFCTILLSGQSTHAAAARVMPLGDSITRGTNDINYPYGSIPGGYRRELGIRFSNAGLAYDFVGGRNDNAASGMDADHQGVDGMRTDQVLANLAGTLSYYPDTILLHVGSNDILQNVPVNTAASNLNSLIHQITVNAPNRRLYVATIIPITQNWQGRSAAYLNANANAYNNQVRGLVQYYANQGRKVTLVDMNARIVLYNSNSYYNFFQPGDGIHPGQAGYNQMAYIWFSTVSASGSLVGQPTNGGGGGGGSAAGGSDRLYNGGFEAGFAGWSYSGNCTVAGSPYTATDGARLVAFNGGNQPSNGALAQSFATVPGATYTLSFDTGVYSYNGNSQTLQVGVYGSGTLLSRAVTVYGAGGGTNRWYPQSFTFVANTGSTTLYFQDRSSSTAALDLMLDRVRVVGAAP